jgi:hypothetical protein
LFAAIFTSQDVEITYELDELRDMAAWMCRAVDALLPRMNGETRP